MNFIVVFLKIVDMDHEKRPKVGVGVVVLKEGRVLLGKRKGSHGAGEWACPGGHLEFGEDVAACGVRELLEETGLKALSWKLGPWVSNVIDAFDTNKHYITLFVIVDKFEGELKLLEPEKCEGWQWFKWEALPEPLFPTISSFIQVAKNAPISFPSSVMSIDQLCPDSKHLT